MSAKDYDYGKERQSCEELFDCILLDMNISAARFFSLFDKMIKSLLWLFNIWLQPHIPPLHQIAILLISRTCMDGLFSSLLTGLCPSSHLSSILGHVQPTYTGLGSRLSKNPNDLATIYEAEHDEGMKLRQILGKKK